MRGAIAGAVIVLGAAVVAWWVWPDASAPVVEDGDGTKKDLIKEVAPAVATNAVQGAVAQKKDLRFRDPNEGRLDWEKMKLPFEEAELLTATTNRDGRIVERYRTADGKTHMVMRPKKRVFKNASDARLALALTSPEGIMLAPMPNTGITKEEFLESLKTPIEIEEDDSERVRMMKETVIAAREQMKAALDAGQSFDDVLAEHRKTFNENTQIRNDVLRELRALQREGDLEGAEVYREAMNQQFDKMGISRVEMPDPRGDNPKTRKAARAAKEKRQ